jgi:LPS sulfotransferase NodH
MLNKSEDRLKEALGIGANFQDPAYFCEILAKASTPNGVFGAKLMWPQMEALVRGDLGSLRLGSSDESFLTLPHLHYIRMHRRDRPAQAASFLIAQRSGRWHWLTTDADAPAGWSLADINAELGNHAQRSSLLHQFDICRMEIEQQDAAWRRFFDEQSIVPLHIEYEELVADPHGVTRRVLSFLGLHQPKHLDFSRGQLLPMSDARNAALVAAYVGRTAPDDPNCTAVTTL